MDPAVVSGIRRMTSGDSYLDIANIGKSVTDSIKPKSINYDIGPDGKEMIIEFSQEDQARLLKTSKLMSELQANAKDVMEGNGKVITKEGLDVTKEFIKGAKEVVEIAKKLPISAAILKEGSPSCGVNFVYDGSFNGNKVKGKGITTEMLNEIGIKTLSEKDLEVNSVNV